MKLRILAVPMMMCLGFLPGLAQALGLGELTLRSHLNEPLDAEIELLSPGKLTNNEILPSLAGDAEFKRARMERFFHLSLLRYEVVRNRAGRLAIRVTTEQPVTEPFLNFLMELNWPTGRILREYTILLDPVPFARTRPKPVARTISQAPKQISEPVAPAPTPAPKPAATTSRPRTSVVSAPAPVKKKSSSSFTGDSYGPVKARDTLWKIASRVRPGGVSMNQTMLAIQRANPDAFLNNNINLLRRGVTLSIPTADQIRGTSNTQAAREVLRQEKQWKVDRGVAPKVSKPAQPTETANLKLVTPTATATADATSAAGGSAAAEMIPASEDVDTQLAVAKESLDKVARDKADAEARATELQAQLETLQRLLTLKDAQLASLQNKLADGGSTADLADVSAVKELADSDAATDAIDTLDAATPELPGMDSLKGTATDALEDLSADATSTADELTGDIAEAGSGMLESTMGSAADAMETVTEPMDAAGMMPGDSVLEPVAAPEITAPAPVSAPAPAPVAEQTLIEKFMANPMAVAGAGGAAILALLGGFFVMRRRGGDTDLEADSLLTPAAGKSLGQKPEDFEPSLASLPEVGDKKEQDLDDLLSATEDLVPEKTAPAAEADAAVPSLDELTQELTADIAGSREEDTLVAADSAAQTTVADLEDELDAELDALSGLADEGDFGLGLGEESTTAESSGEPEAPSVEAPVAALDEALTQEDDFSSLDLDSDVAELSAELDTEFSLDDTGVEDVAETFTESKLDDVALGEELIADDTEKDLDALAAELDDLTFETPSETPAAVSEPDLGEELDLDLEAATAETMAETTSGADELNLDDDLDFVDVEDEASTKIDLARAYMDMGDLEGAREILDEVVIEGNDAQKAEAQGLLDKL